MPALNLPNLNFNIDSGTDKQTLEQIVDSLSKYRKELNFLLMNLDTDNMPFIESKLTDIDGNLSSVVQTVDAINLTVGSNTGDISNLQIQANSISSTVAGNTGDISAVTQTANAVTLDFANLKTLTGGQQINNGVTTISPTGIKVQHTNFPGQYSEMRADGFIRKWAYGEGAYLNDIYIIQNISSGNSYSYPITKTLTLPTRFKNRTNTKILLVPRLFKESDLTYFVSASQVKRWTSQIMLSLNVESTNFNLTYPTIVVSAYLYIKKFSEATETYDEDWNDVTFDLIAIGV